MNTISSFLATGLGKYSAHAISSTSAQSQNAYSQTEAQKSQLWEMEIARMSFMILTQHRSCSVTENDNGIIDDSSMSQKGDMAQSLSPFDLGYFI